LPWSNPTMMRVVRLVRIVRILKMVRTVQNLDSLYLLIKSIQASLGALFWSFVLLLVIQVAVGMFFNQMLRRYIDDSSKDMESRQLVFSYWGTFTRTMITMFEITLANWSPSCRVLIEHVSEAYGIVYILYRCMFCFAVLRVISAVFITETNRVVSGDDDLAIRKTRRTQARHLQRLRDFFEEVDMDHNGTLEWDEFQRVLSDPLVAQWLRTLEIDPSDLEELFGLLDDGDGQISMEEFIRGANKMKGSAKAMDMVNLLSHVKRVHRKLDELMQASCAPSASGLPAKAPSGLEDRLTTFT